MSKAKIRKLQGVVEKIEKTGERKGDEKGTTWEKCVFVVRLKGFSKRTPKEKIPTHLVGKKVKLIRWCAYDWHYRLGVRKTLEPDETETILMEKPTDTFAGRRKSLFRKIH